MSKTKSSKNKFILKPNPLPGLIVHFLGLLSSNSKLIFTAYNVQIQANTTETGRDICI